MDHESWVIVLSPGGLAPDAAALATLADTRIEWQRVTREGAAACLAARVRHHDTPERFRDRVRAWGQARGWAVAVAPGSQPG